MSIRSLYMMQTGSVCESSYQLRGRVGRPNRSAYAFLLDKCYKMIKEVAEKRLKAIREFTDLGSGYKIAMKDLEIRGAGNLLGQEQSEILRQSVMICIARCSQRCDPASRLVRRCVRSS